MGGGGRDDGSQGGEVQVLYAVAVDNSPLASASPIASFPAVSTPSPRRQCDDTNETSVGAPDGSEVDMESRMYFAQARESVEAALLIAVPTNTSHPRARAITDSMRYSLLAPAKRVRPLLCLAVCDMFGGPRENALPCAVAIEMIHTMSLIHDDLPPMDNDDLRRGLPTNHVKFGEAVAILAGDALLAGAFDHLARACPPSLHPSAILAVLGKLGQAVGPDGLAGGQVADLALEGQSNVTVDDVEWVHKRKTAALLRAAAAAGAIVANASDEDIRRVELFAENVGLAFQIQDDVLDVTQPSVTLGKTAHKDSRSGKSTYPSLIGLEKSRARAQELVVEALDLLEHYGDKAKPLRALASFVIARTF